MKVLTTRNSGYLVRSFINQYQNKYLFKKVSLVNQKVEDINFMLKGESS